MEEIDFSDIKKQLKMKIAVIPNNPNKNEEIKKLERNGIYEKWGGGLSCIQEVGQLVIFYISGNIKQYRYLAQVTKIEKDGFDVKLLSTFNDEISSKFTREKLNELGLPKEGPIRYCLDKYPKIYDYVLKVLTEHNLISEQEIKIISSETISVKDKQLTQSLNQILYGPPGTGKTYNTINKAIEIIENKILTNDELQDRETLKRKFKEYRNKSQIEFITFHQSYGYEEFVEGIKADTNNKDEIVYVKEDGIFKKLCEQAKGIKVDTQSLYNFDDNVNIWKISLGDSQNTEEDYLFDYCREKKKILLGFGNGLNFDDCKNRGEIANKLGDMDKFSYPPTAINILKNKIKKDDIVLVSYGNRKLRAIARIIGDYEYLEDDELKSYVQARPVEWLIIPEEPFPYEKILKKQFSQMSIYNIKNNVKIESLRELLTKTGIQKNDKRYILIIDEINRGNISKIFGELITLVEESKRIGAQEELKITLPYTGDEFGVPDNLYILGTMNTADRSIALMDTALRRRFEFIEMMPELDEVKNVFVEGIDIYKLLETINKRIEYLYDRDHTIGHAYFMKLKDSDSLDTLATIFQNKLLPLLQEYFYDDWEKIRLVLGDNQKENENIQFVKHKQGYNLKVLFGEKGLDSLDVDEESNVYEVNKLAFYNTESYIKIYEK